MEGLATNNIDLYNTQIPPNACLPVFDFRCILASFLRPALLY